MGWSTSSVTHPWVEEGRGKLRFGIALPSVANDWVAQRDLAQAVDGLGFNSLWAIDHPSLVADYWIALAAYYGPIIAAGAQYLIFTPLVGIDVETLRLVAERVLPELQQHYASINH